MAINQGNTLFFLDQVMLLLSSGWFWILIFLICFSFAVFKKVPGIWLFGFEALVTASISDLFAYRVLKPYFSRLRPCHQMAELVRLVQDGCGSQFGFPSNHATNAMALTMIFLLYFPFKIKTRCLILILPLLVGLSRIYLGVHFPGDIIAGFFIGGLVAYLVWATVNLGQKVKSSRAL